MKTLSLTIDCDNAAFYDEAENPDAGAELARILRAVAAKIEAGHDGGRCMDANGSAVGNWSIE